jgi:hypothetical protein
LFNVLRAFASYDEEVGYCQGMTNIVATILMYCEEEVKNRITHLTKSLQLKKKTESILSARAHVFTGQIA